MCFFFFLSFLFEKTFYNIIMVPLELRAGFFFLSFSVFTAAFSLGELSSVLKSRENKQEVLSNSKVWKSELHLPSRRASSKGLLFGWKRRKSSYSVSPCTPPPPTLHPEVLYL